MANTTTSPNMGMPVPTVSQDPGPDWATNIDACLSIIDSHNHSNGQGVTITPSGMNINTDLPFGGNNATGLRSSRFTAQGSPLGTASDLGCLYVSGVDLYYNDENGNQVRITQGGSVTGSSGTITGLPSGTASASFSGGTFTFQSATNTPATMNTGPIVTGAAVASSKTVTLAASASQPSNYSLTWPTAAPAANQIQVSDGSGNLSWTLGVLPLGSIIATFPNLTGAYTTTATNVADDHGFVLCHGQTMVDATSPMNGQVIPNLSGSVFILGSTTSGTTGGSATSSALLAHTHTFTSSTAVAPSNHHHIFSHVHQWAYQVSSATYFTLDVQSPSTVSFTTVGTTSFMADDNNYAGGVVRALNGDVGITASYYTAGVTSAPTGSGATAATDPPNEAGVNVSGTTGSTGSGSSFSIVPPFVSAVYLMRVK